MLSIFLLCHNGMIILDTDSLDPPTGWLGRVIRINLVFKELQKCQPQELQSVQSNDICLSPNFKATRRGVHTPEIASQAPTTLFVRIRNPFASQVTCASSLPCCSLELLIWNSFNSEGRQGTCSCSVLGEHRRVKPNRND